MLGYENISLCLKMRMWHIIWPVHTEQWEDDEPVDLGEAYVHTNPHIDSSYIPCNKYVYPPMYDQIFTHESDKSLPRVRHCHLGF